METMYVVSRQTTTGGTATDITKVVGKDLDEAILNAKIKGYKLMESFKNEKTMVSAFFGVTDLKEAFFYVSEYWTNESQAE